MSGHTDGAPGRGSGYTRRTVLAGTGAALGACLLPGQVRAAGEDPTDLTEWFADTDGATEVVDERGTDAVTVAVGVDANGGAFGFGPPAVRVDPGTEVTWEWTGNGGSHNVVAEDGSFGSEYDDAAGTTFAYTPTESGVIRYACAPHKAMGMRGTLVVGDAAVTFPGGATGGDAETPTGTPEPEQLGPMRSFDGWLDGTSNYRGVADRRGEAEVTVKVGATGNGGEFAFEPAAVHVDPGTVVRWEWVGTAGAYDVVDPALGYASEQVQGTGKTFALRFDGDGLSKYECTEYGDQGMRGVVLVGEGPVGELTWRGVGAAAGVAGLVAAPIALGVRYHFENVTGGGGPDRPES
ncbi:halocyanin domain-containing protein [Halorarum halophilum]|uniref:Halocyanin domain-containing protein n=1 Tax=Halorarum halophilum TaxID=2743090 RepID=A0A7D5K814_9EURY|nr:halocyanin domain-containing protein [Halobaculum halophilum]QLG27939.1 halocyanin domain-containing protein [Halobaculum halophilum]